MRRSITLAIAGLALVSTGLSAQLSPAVTGQAVSTGPTIQGFLFGDARYVTTEGTDPGFGLGQVVAHANGSLSEHVVFFGELSLSYRGSSYVTTVERAILRYDFNDAVKVSVGRYHTPISYWNTAYHHGLWLQGSVDRPRAVTFGTNFIPVHFVGAMVEGHVPGTPLHYMGGVGNGRNSSGVGAQDGGDANGNRAVILSGSVQPIDLGGFRVGGGMYLDRVPDSGAGETDERILSAHAVWNRGMLEVVAEYIDVSHEPASGGASLGSSAYYVHAGVRLPSGPLEDVTPYARWEDTDIDAADPVFGATLSNYEALVAGVRYDFDGLAALKSEYRSETFGTGSAVSSLVVQASFAIPVGGQS